jgi:hypothetical protein
VEPAYGHVLDRLITYSTNFDLGIASLSRGYHLAKQVTRISMLVASSEGDCASEVGGSTPMLASSTTSFSSA